MPRKSCLLMYGLLNAATAGPPLLPLLTGVASGSFQNAAKSRNNIPIKARLATRKSCCRPCPSEYADRNPLRNTAEAAGYYHIGEGKLWMLIDAHPNEDF